MGGSHVESLWFLALSSKCHHFSTDPHNIIFLFAIPCVVYAFVSFLYWAHPGGLAWGKYYYSSRLKQQRHQANLIPPGPVGFPFIGSITLMVSLAHCQLASMAKRLHAERLMALSLGDTRVLVTCNPDIAKQILNSSIFADRPPKESANGLMFSRAIGFAPYGVYWKALRRIAAVHMFSPRQISCFEGWRAEIAADMVRTILQVGAHSDGGQGYFVVREVLKRASLSNMMGSVFGRRYELGAWEQNFDGEAMKLSRLVEEGYDLLGTVNLSDHFPLLSRFDLQKIRFRCSKLVPRVDRILTPIVREHRERAPAPGGSQSHDFVDLLLSLKGSDKLCESDMIAVLWEMIFRGTDTVAVVIEWVLARMVLHPDIQSKVQDELDKVVGTSRPLKESDLPSLHYLQAVIKEALRLHPPGPLLSWARLAITDTTVDGYHVPAGTTAMVNMWAIAREPEIWANPLKFSPERFLQITADHQAAAEPGLSFSVLGTDLRLAPFGSGRRSCPGKALGLVTVGIWVGTLLHEFEWAHSGQDPVDVSEVLRLSCEMAHPLTVVARPRRRQSQ